VAAKSIFATHYHELIAVADKLARAQNFCVAVHEEEKGVVFLHKIQAGGTARSYGIEVAKLAGLPPEVIKKSEHILACIRGKVLISACKIVHMPTFSGLSGAPAGRSRPELLNRLPLDNILRNRLSQVYQVNMLFEYLWAYRYKFMN